MSAVPPQRRPGGPTVDLILDIISHARLRRSWLTPVLVVVIVVAVLAAWFGQTVLPWSIYPAL